MKIMAVDYGDTRTGIAVSDKTEFLASPVGTIVEKRFDECVKKVVDMAKQQQAEAIVVGYPKNMNGTIGPRAEKCDLFAQKIREQVDVEVTLWDERSTTVSAHNILNETNTRGKKRKEVIDTVAACLILESFMAYRKNKKSK